jgi:hypothetical protein
VLGRAAHRRLVAERKEQLIASGLEVAPRLIGDALVVGGDVKGHVEHARAEAQRGASRARQEVAPYGVVVATVERGGGVVEDFHEHPTTEGDERVFDHVARLFGAPQRLGEYLALWGVEGPGGGELTDLHVDRVAERVDSLRVKIAAELAG